MPPTAADMVVARWVPDPPYDHPTRPVRFIEEGEIRCDPRAVAHGLRQLVEAVLDRLTTATDEDACRLRANWRAVCESQQSEGELCSGAASMGVDPYDERELTEELTEVLTERVPALPAELRSDLLEAASRSCLSADLDWLDGALPQIAPASAPRSEPVFPIADTAHQLGYERAAWFRRQFALPVAPVADLAALLYEKCGWPPAKQQVSIVEGTRNLTALVGRDAAGNARVVGPALGHWAQRFRLARSLFFLPDPAESSPPRLVTRAYTWDQRASRAFAAELLAPAELLSAEVRGSVAGDDLDRLARKFDVRPTLIEHQLRNHHIAWLDES